MTAIRRNIRGLFLLILGLATLAACIGQQELLNSDRIEQRYGSYGVNVLSRDGSLRRASLYSLENGREVCRTYAITLFPDSIAGDIADIHETIVEGASIGATFRANGWAVRKLTLFIGSVELQDSAHPLAALMNIATPAVLATHVYELNVEKGSAVHRYARIVETHHPDYLGVDQLRDIYGQPMSASPGSPLPIDELVLIDHWN